MKWEGLYYFEKRLPFGLCSAPFLFTQLSEVIEWILKSKCAISYVTHFLDDFLIMEPSSNKSSGCEASLRCMLITFRNLGVPIAQGKAQGPSTKLEYLGITLDTDLMEASLLIDKVSRLRSELKSWHERKSATLVQLQSLIGSLQFACKVIPPGRAFLQRIINYPWSKETTSSRETK